MKKNRLFDERLGFSLLAAASLSLAACSPPKPRTFDHFMEDSIARDGALARCARDPGAHSDIECANARRAATAVQLGEERARRERLEQESEAKIQALRRDYEAQRQAAREAEAAAAALAAQYLITPEPTGDAITVEPADGAIMPEPTDGAVAPEPTGDAAAAISPRLEDAANLTD